jgi:hypothetical protein
MTNNITRMDELAVMVYIQVPVLFPPYFLGNRKPDDASDTRMNC